MQVVFAFFFSVGVQLGVVDTPCTSPVVYRLGDIDEHFGLSQEEVQDALLEAEALWESSTGRNLFEFRTDAQGLPVQFVYDERQQQEEERRILERERQVIEEEPNISTDPYERAVGLYRNMVAAYETRLSVYNQAVQKVNARGGATDKEYKKLTEEKQALENLYGDIQVQVNTVNGLAREYNQSVEDFNATVEAFNDRVQTFEQKYGMEQEFDQGVYDGQAIRVYTFRDHENLVLVLAHELGHALGIAHVDEPKALMYYLMKEQDVLRVGLEGADTAALQDVCLHGSQLYE